MIYKISSFPKGRSIVIKYLVLAIFLWPSVALSQKYSFTNYGIEDGLSQSQATQIVQDKNHRLVIATFLGINRFDGKTFTPLIKDNGLTDLVSGLTIDHSGKIWCSNAKGLYYFYGDKATRFVGDNHNLLINATGLVADNLDNIWGLTGQRLFRISRGHVDNINITGGEDSVTTITINKHGEMLAAVLNKGIYCLRNDKWINIIPLDLPQGAVISQFIVDRTDDDAIYFSTGTKVFSARNNTTRKIKIDLQKNGASLINCIAQDNSNGLWIGTNKGACYFKNNNLEYFDGTNGFTNYPVFDIFNDVDNNVWFGTSGAGVFRFDGDGFLIFDQAQGINEPILQMANDKNNKVLMTGGTKLLSYSGKKISQIKIPLMDATDVFHCLYRDRENNTWIVTLKGLWKKTGANFTRVYPRNKNDPRILFNAMLEDQLKTTWIITSNGCYYWDKGFKKISGVNLLCTGLIETGRDSILVGTSKPGYFHGNGQKNRHQLQRRFLKRFKCIVFEIL